MILNCTCEHESQDKIHGKGRRVHNLTGKYRHRCTVCGNETGSADQVDKKSKRK